MKIIASILFLILFLGTSLLISYYVLPNSSNDFNSFNDIKSIVKSKVSKIKMVPLSSSIKTIPITCKFNRAMIIEFIAGGENSKVIGSPNTDGIFMHRGNGWIAFIHFASTGRFTTTTIKKDMTAVYSDNFKNIQYRGNCKIV